MVEIGTCIKREGLGLRDILSHNVADSAMQGCVGFHTSLLCDNAEPQNTCNFCFN